MNRNITAGWGVRRTGLNLNTSQAAVTALAAAAAASAPGAAADASTPQQATTPDGASAPTSPPHDVSSTPRNGEAGPSRSSRATSPSGTASKRKLRAKEAGSSKRSRNTTGAEGVGDKYAPPATRLRDLGGVGPAIEKVLELIAMPLCHPEIYAHTGVKPPRGVLLHGPPGCGKTMLAGAIAGDLSIPFLPISAPSIVSGTSGESEATLRSLFEEAARLAPCILFIDEIDAITPKRETAQREMERRIVAQLLTCLDDLSWDKTQGRPVMVIGATNRPDSLDPALRRAGRFDHEIALGVPDEDGREQILRVLSASLRLSGDFDYRALAKSTPGYVGADLVALTAAAGILAVKRIFSQMGDGGHALITAAASATEGGKPNGTEVAAQEEADVEMAWEISAVPDKVQELTDSTGAASLTSDASTAAPAAAAAAPPPAPSAPAPNTSTALAVARPTSSFFDALPAALQHSSIATFLRTHPSALTSAQLEPLSITNDDFILALPGVQPSSKREGFATVPDVTWADVGALHETRDELSMAIVEPIRRPEMFRAVGVSASSGVLLWGPPGCGKTLLAKAVANESGANFISVKGPELLNKYVGESERAVRQVFARARTSSPCVIFFDELDALVPRRDDALSESSSRVVNTLLTELDGLESRVQTYVIGATNRPDMIDPAMCRPGRLDKLLYVDLPTPTERLEIIRTLTKRTPLVTSGPESVDLSAIATDARADGFSGADLAALTREAAVTALRQSLKAAREASDADALMDPAALAARPAAVTPAVVITHAHFSAALDKVSPSVSLAQRAKYAALRNRLSGSPAGAGQGSRRAAAPAAGPSGGQQREGGDGEPALA